MPGDESLPGSEGSGSVNLGLGLHNLKEGEQQLIADGQQRRQEAGDPPGPLLRPRNPASASASANTSPQPAPRPAGESEDVETQPPQMSDITAFTASLQVAHDAAEAQRVEAAKLREELATANAKVMEETITAGRSSDSRLRRSPSRRGERIPQGDGRCCQCCQGCGGGDRSCCG